MPDNTFVLTLSQHEQLWAMIHDVPPTVLFRTIRNMYQNRVAYDDQSPIVIQGCDAIMTELSELSAANEARSQELITQLRASLEAKIP